MRVSLVFLVYICWMGSVAAASDLLCIYDQVCQSNECEQIAKPIEIQVLETDVFPIFLIPTEFAPSKSRMPNDLVSSFVNIKEMMNAGQAAFGFTIDKMDPDSGWATFLFDIPSPFRSFAQFSISPRFQETSTGPKAESRYFFYRKAIMFNKGTQYLWHGLCEEIQ